MPPKTLAIEAAWELLDALNEADGARGLDDTQWARWEVTKAREKLKKALDELEDS